MQDIDCYDLKDCPGMCPPGGWRNCSANPERVRQAKWALWCFLGAVAIVAAAILLRAVA